MTRLYILALLVGGASAGHVEETPLGRVQRSFTAKVSAAAKREATAPAPRRQLIGDDDDGYPSHDDWGQNTVFCDSDLNDEVSGPTNVAECWQACYDAHGDDIVAIDWEDGSYCFCQDDCRCMQDLSGSLTNEIWVIAGLDEPGNCDATGCDQTPYNNCLFSNDCESLDDDGDDDDDDDDDDEGGPSSFTCAGFEPLVRDACALLIAAHEGPCPACVDEVVTLMGCNYDTILAGVGLTCEMTDVCAGNTLDAAAPAWTRATAAAACAAGAAGLALL